MASPFMSEIRIMGFTFAPRGWAMCNGQVLPINQNPQLFKLLGKTFGGDGQTTFALPDLRGRAPIHAGDGYTLGEAGGEQSHTLSVAELPTHTHTAQATSGGGVAFDPTNTVLAAANNLYAAYNEDQTTSLLPQTVTSAGGSTEHPNMQPFLTLTFAIALQGLTPSAS